MTALQQAIGRARTHGAVLCGAALCALFFLVTRGLALFIPYHQDEYKWALAADPSSELPLVIPHPPLGKLLYHFAGEWIGYGNLRVVPVLLSLVLMALLFMYMRERYSARAGLVAVGAYIVSFYAFLASVQIDIDGMLLPLAALLTFFGYERFAAGAPWRKWAPLAAAGVLIGVFTKLSYYLVPITIILHFLWMHPRYVRMLARTRVILAFLVACAAAGVAAYALWDSVTFLKNVRNFSPLQSRDVGQLLFLTTKAVLFLSPLVPVAIILGLRSWRTLALWYAFLAVNVGFYYVAFDFSHRTLDRYLMFAILPGAVIAGYALDALAAQVREKRLFTTAFVAAAAGFAVLTHRLWLMPYDVVALIPKSEFVSRFLAGRWDFLLPLTGGSGPLGFYVPLSGTIYLWLIAAALAAGVFVRKTRTVALAAFIALAIVYNGFFAAEYVAGYYFGSSGEVARDLVAAVRADPGIGSIITYNDIAAYELVQMGAYGGRFYPHDEFIAGNAEKFRQSAGYYLVVNMPALNPDSPYVRFFAECREMASSTDRQISGAVYDCREASFDVFGGE